MVALLTPPPLPRAAAAGLLAGLAGLDPAVANGIKDRIKETGVVSEADSKLLLQGCRNNGGCGWEVARYMPLLL